MTGAVDVTKLAQDMLELERTPGTATRTANEAWHTRAQWAPDLAREVLRLQTERDQAVSEAADLRDDLEGYRTDVIGLKIENAAFSETVRRHEALATAHIEEVARLRNNQRTEGTHETCLMCGNALDLTGKVIAKCGEHYPNSCPIRKAISSIGGGHEQA